ncbi:hypothetical protein C8R42DRAFT_637594 [Lentinula raphanica]|nr:hypothetical protein C8R42DRAFT_637594 [Lentinula raphanica]
MTKTPGPNYTTNEDRWMNHVTTGPNTPRGWSCKTENMCNAKVIARGFRNRASIGVERQSFRGRGVRNMHSFTGNSVPYSPAYPAAPQNVPAFSLDPSSLFRLAYLASNAASFEPGHFRDAVLHLLQAHGLLDSRSDLELIPAGFVDGLAASRSLSRATQATQEALHQQLLDAKTLQTILEWYIPFWTFNFVSDVGDCNL